MLEGKAVNHSVKTVMQTCPHSAEKSRGHGKLVSLLTRSAFTLTEVLLAVVIVGVIAALVLPTVVTHFQEKRFDQAYKRETKTIEAAINGLAVNENKSSFFHTMMYSATEPESYENNAEIFLKKYLRVSKICTENSNDCFAKTYYEYKDNDKKVFTPNYKGACASLKNGTSLCLTPQIGASAITGIIDLNGPKGPNIINKDLRTFTLSSISQTGRDTEVASVLDTDFAPIETEDPCAGMTCGCGTLPPCPPECSSNPNEWDLSCCQYNSSSINSNTHHCCTYNSFKSQEVCKMAEDYTVHFHCAFVDLKSPDINTSTGELASNVFGFVPQGKCFLKVDTNHPTLAQWIMVEFRAGGHFCIDVGCSPSYGENDNNIAASLYAVSGGETDSQYVSQYQSVVIPLNKIGRQYWSIGAGGWACQLTIYDQNTSSILKKYDASGNPEKCKTLYSNFQWTNTGN